jgi:dipeptidyl aminopeptidase/acylaminoacyl peptidase
VTEADKAGADTPEADTARADAARADTAGADTAEADKAVAPYGSWPSPISIDDVIGGATALAEVWVDGADILWVEGRPSEAGRRILVRRAPDGTVRDVTPTGFNVRNRVHEYGGGSLVVAGGVVVFSHFGDGRLYRQRTDGSDAPTPITPEGEWRYADLRVDAGRGRLLAVREDHTGQGEAVNEIVALPLDGSAKPTVIAHGHDFFAAPRPSPDGAHLAWLSWDHPNLPWDGTTLWQADVAADGSVGDPQAVAGGPDEWISQPRWSPSGELWFVAERDEWATLMSLAAYRAGERGRLPIDFAPPDWIFDRPTHAFLPDGRVVAAARTNGRDRVWLIDTNGGTPREIESPFTEIAYLVGAGDAVVFVGSRPTEANAVVRLDPATGHWEALRSASDRAFDAAYLAQPEPIAFPTTGGATAHALYYAPTNPAVGGLDGELPPLIVRSHGGPTSSASTGLSLSTQLMTSRGIAVVDVDYGGSTGYGRSYRKRLEGQWGVVDLDDCVAAARHLVERGLADPARVCIEGGSAGGYTTLAALAFRDAFAAGICYFGIGDLEAFVRDTHKFEARYLDRLVGPYPAEAATYRERSPVHYLDRLACPLLILQGLDDRVVPPNQSQMMADALRAKGIPYAYLAFEGEGHGFRGQAALRRSMEAELSFLGQVFGFTPADPIEQVELVRREEPARP